MFGQAMNMSQSQMSTSQTIDSQFQQISLINAAKTAGAAEQRSMDSAMGVQYGAGTNAPNAAVGQQTKLWAGINNGLHALSFIFIPISGLSLFTAMVIKSDFTLLLGFAVVFFIFLTHTILYESGWGQANMGYSTIPTSSLVAGIVLGGTSAVFLSANQPNQTKASSSEPSGP